MAAAPAPASTTPVVQISGVVRAYGGLRPLRLASLAVAEAERVAIQGLDAAAAEVLINLVTGATLPETGEVRVYGRATSEIAGGDEWLASLDRFGIVSPRAVVMDAATIEQNLAMPFTLEIEPVPPGVADRVARLAEDAGIAASWLARRAGEAPADVRARLHIARALALDPAILLLEHPTVGVDRSAVAPLAADVARALDRRRLTTLVVTEDNEFASKVATRTLQLQPGTGELRRVRRGWFR